MISVDVGNPALRSARDMATSAFDGLGIGLVLLDELGSILHWNRTLSEWTGIHPQEAEGRSVFAVIPELSRPRFRLRLETVQQGGPSIRFSGLLHRPPLRTTSELPSMPALETRVSSWLDPGTEQRLTAIHFHDLTESLVAIRHYRETRDAARREATQQHRENLDLHKDAELLSASNEELEQFAYMATHDLREPLQNIRMLVELLSEEVHSKIDEDEMAILQRIGQSGERLEALLSDSLSLLRAGSDGGEPCVLNTVAAIEDVKLDLASRIEETNATIHVGDLPDLLADPISIHHLLLNVMSNALKFRHPDRPSEIRVRGSEASLFTPNGEMMAVRLSISDNGIGFDPRHAKDIFKPFRRLHGRGGGYGGHGLGLAICRRIVRMHNGQIWAESTIGEGTTVQMMLPGAPEEPKSRASFKEQATTDETVAAILDEALQR